MAVCLSYLGRACVYLTPTHRDTERDGRPSTVDIVGSSASDVPQRKTERLGRGDKTACVCVNVNVGECVRCVWCVCMYHRQETDRQTHTAQPSLYTLFWMDVMFFWSKTSHRSDTPTHNTRQHNTTPPTHPCNVCVRKPD
uniref:Uncharacterized protein n=1 Tax=Vitrella brassicaformis TaxID=1169539 RepID=A0A7S1JJS2_9ALVE|mmetsp:Transcript_11967/g.28695  ORF Transcript_11967/g.28695 Transcript_11967/m.28695 type:complete len:140 (+) Transcript_11967:468-887(+)